MRITKFLALLLTILFVGILTSRANANDPFVRMKWDNATPFPVAVSVEDSVPVSAMVTKDGVNDETPIATQWTWQIREIWWSPDNINWQLVWMIPSESEESDVWEVTTDETDGWVECWLEEGDSDQEVTLKSTFYGAGYYSIIVDAAASPPKSAEIIYSDGPADTGHIAVAVDRIIVKDSNPEQVGGVHVKTGATVSMKAMPNPSGVGFPTSSPVWAIQSQPSLSSADLTASGDTATICTDKDGDYVITATCGTTSATFKINATPWMVEVVPWTQMVAGASGRGDVPNIPMNGYLPKMLSGNDGPKQLLLALKVSFNTPVTADTTFVFNVSSRNTQSGTVSGGSNISVTVPTGETTAYSNGTLVSPSSTTGVFTATGVDIQNPNGADLVALAVRRTTGLATGDPDDGNLSIIRYIFVLATIGPPGNGTITQVTNVVTEAANKVDFHGDEHLSAAATQPFDNFKGKRISELDHPVIMAVENGYDERIGIGLNRWNITATAMDGTAFIGTHGDSAMKSAILYARTSYSSRQIETALYGAAYWWNWAHWTNWNDSVNQYGLLQNGDPQVLLSGITRITYPGYFNTYPVWTGDSGTTRISGGGFTVQGRPTLPQYAHQPGFMVDVHTSYGGRDTHLDNQNIWSHYENDVTYWTVTTTPVGATSNLPSIEVSTTPKWTRTATCQGEAFVHSNGSKAIKALLKYIPMKFSLGGNEINLGDLVVENFPTDEGRHANAYISGNMASALPIGTYIYSGASPKEWGANTPISADGGGLDAPAASKAFAVSSYGDDYQPMSLGTLTQIVTMPSPVRFPFNGAPGPSSTKLPVWVGGTVVTNKDSADQHAWALVQWTEVTVVPVGVLPFTINVPQTNVP